MLKPLKTRYYFTLLQILLVLFALGAVILLNKDHVEAFFQTTQSGHLGLILNGVILLIFLLGLVRMLFLFLSFTREQEALQTFYQRLADGMANPTHNISARSLIIERFFAVRTIAQQHAEVNQSALASTLSASISTQFTLVRFVQNILILTGVFGTIVSLSVALVGAAGLLDSPESMQKMGTIIGGMSTALSTTMTAIVCYILFAYFHLRLQDARTQLLANIETVTTVYILPRFKQVETNLLHDVASLTKELRQAADGVNQIQGRFLQAGERLQLAVDDLQMAVSQSGENIQIIRDSVREGFRLDTTPKE